MKSGNVIVIGAGPAGLTAAYRLAQKGRPVQVFEAGQDVGGLSRSLDLWGQRVDLGPHRFFSTSGLVNDFWREIVGADFTVVDRLTRIYFRKRFFHYPLQPLNAFFNLGPVDVVACLASYAFASLPRSGAAEPRTFEEWIISRFGNRLYRYFFKSYTEKVWGIPCTRIDADWAAQRIKTLSLFEALKSTVINDGQHQTLNERFYYPRGGTGTIYRRMSDSVRKWNGEVRLNSPVQEVLLDNDGGRVQGVRLADGTTQEAERVISTMPLTLMVKSLKQAPADVTAACEQLSYRNTILLYAEVDSKNLFPDNWVYVHSPDVQHGRITNFRNWCPSLHGDRDSTILCMEYWCFDRDSIWNSADASIEKLGEDELRRIGLIPPNVKILNRKVVRIPRSYPVYEIGYQEPLRKIQSYVEGIEGLHAIGRYGSFKYNNQDHSIMMGLLTAREILTGRKENLWAVNTDSEYQE